VGTNNRGEDNDDDGPVVAIHDILS
jgi:hypothetical protein